MQRRLSAPSPHATSQSYNPSLPANALTISTQLYLANTNLLPAQRQPTEANFKHFCYNKFERNHFKLYTMRPPGER